MAVLSNGVGEWSAYELENGEPKPLKSVVSFVDILGYKEKVNKAATAGDTQLFLSRFRQALFGASSYLEGEQSCYTFNFTDSVVIGWPINRDSEVPLCISCWNLATYQLFMTTDDFFIRGGIAVGEAYFDSYVQSGEAFIKAYEAESKLAVFPRIVLSEEALKEAQMSCKTYADADSCPLNLLFAVDGDGLVFVSYLAALFEVFSPEDNRQEIVEYLQAHKEVIERNLYLHYESGAIYRKYQWSARYHDWFCERIANWLQEDMLITVDYGRERIAPPRTLLDVFPDWI